MSNKIAIVGAGADVSALTKELAKKGHKDVIVMTPDEAKEYANGQYLKPTDRYKIEAPPMLNYINEKRFVCKGKHEYREIDGVWVCQCGRKISD